MQTPLPRGKPPSLFRPPAFSAPCPQTSRDIKPSNILVDSAGVAKLADLSISKLMREQLTATIVSCSALH